MNGENNNTNFWPDNENLNPNPDFKNLLKISSTNIIIKEYNNSNGDNFTYKKSNNLINFFFNLKSILKTVSKRISSYNLNYDL